MFLGEYEYRVDAKGRVPLPPKYREKLKDGVVLTAGPERCIVAYSPSEWEKLASNLTGGSIVPSKLRRLNRAVFASAYSLEVDGQGRVALPQLLRDHAAVRDEVVVAGANTYFEIWNKKQWQAEKAASQEQAFQIIESLEHR
jgi:transcriptional regulator MraZ